MREALVEVREGETLLAALYRAAAYVEASCGGHGRCGRCRVRIGDDEAWPLACEVTTPGRHRVLLARPVEPPDGILPGGPPTGADLAAAFDVGTTTLAAALVDRGAGAVLGRAAAPNPQAAYGSDVLARAGWARHPEHRERLGSLVRAGLRSLLGGLLRDAGRTAADVRAAALAGNAAMTLLVLGRDPGRLLAPPYEPGLRAEGAIGLAPSLLGLPVDTECFLLPAIGGHVGGDTAAAVLAAGLLDGERPALLVDLGTNGEVVLATASAAFAASSAAGPAFEGGGIEHGSAAGPGAIERVDLADGGLRIGTVEGKPPRSWCGSGVLDLAAALCAAGEIDAGGRLAGAPVLPVPFSQADVREVQLAKGAVAAAIRILAREAGTPLPALRRAVLTGAFGAKVRPESARAVGLLPAGVPAEPLAGGALAGAVLALRPGGREAAERTAARIRHVSLGDREDFQDVFVESLRLAEMVR